MLEIKNIFKSYGEEKVIKNFSLEIKPGEIVAIVGKSGIGKSTLLKCINGIENIDSGDILFENISIKDYNIVELRKKIGIVFQELNLFEHLTVIENVTLPLCKIKKISKDEANEIADRLLRKLNLLSKKNNYPNELSVGQKQRVAIARTIAMDPQLIMFDEPTSALDKKTKELLVDLIAELVKFEKMIIIVSHEDGFLNKITNKIVTFK